MALGGSHSFAQGQGPGNPNPPGQAKKETIKERTVVVSRDVDVNGKGKEKPNKPERPNNPAPGADVQDMIKEFKQARETFLEQQKELNRQAKEDSKEARDALREQQKELLERLKEQQRIIRQETKDRAKTLREELSPDMGRVIDSGAGPGTESGGSGRRGGRER